MGDLVSGRAPPRQEAGGGGAGAHILCLYTTVASMGQSLVGIVAIKQSNCAWQKYLGPAVLFNNNVKKVKYVLVHVVAMLCCVLSKRYTWPAPEDMWTG